MVFTPSQSSKILSGANITWGPSVDHPGGAKDDQRKMDTEKHDVLLQGKRKKLRGKCGDSRL
jgi:hypothetical protein